MGGQVLGCCSSNKEKGEREESEEGQHGYAQGAAELVYRQMYPCPLVSMCLPAQWRQQQQQRLWRRRRQQGEAVGCLPEEPSCKAGGCSNTQANPQSIKANIRDC